VEGPCEQGNEFSGSINFWEILECLLNWQLLKKDSVLWPTVSLHCLFCQETAKNLLPQTNCYSHEDFRQLFHC
jgi:hypothetical protein